VAESDISREGSAWFLRTIDLKIDIQHRSQKIVCANDIVVCVPTFRVHIME